MKSSEYLNEYAAEMKGICCSLKNTLTMTSYQTLLLLTTMYYALN